MGSRILEEHYQRSYPRQHAGVRYGRTDRFWTAQERVIRDVARHRRQALRNALARSIQLAIDQLIPAMGLVPSK